MKLEPELKTCGDVICLLKVLAFDLATNKKMMRESDAERFVSLILLLNLLPE